MYFKKLEIVGFKSFAEKTTLYFEPGITAIVGPNGCGKSNIFDAIRWVLGEQSIKSLRGSKMEDVIFNGTENTAALNMAEVSISFSNEAKILPIDYEEVTITRRLFRSGESEYIINNNPVRLKDINELFMGTGIGAESYSLVEQGKIELILSSKPEDRRLVFDEATGVSKYKAKKKEALRKLEDTENNLVRVNDIIQEVKRQISSIERQATKARRYKEIFDKLKDLEIKLSQFEIKNLNHSYAKIEQSEQELKESLNQLLGELERLNKSLASEQNNLNLINESISNLNNEFTNIQNLIERDKQHILISQERISDFSARIALIESQEGPLKSKIEQAKKTIENLTLEFQNLKTQLLDKQKALEEKDSQLKQLELQIEKDKEEIKKANNLNFEHTSSITKLNNELIDIASSYNTANARKRRLEVEVTKTHQEKQSQYQLLQATRQEVLSLTEKCNELKNQYDSLNKTFLEIEKEIKDIEAEITRLNSDRISHQSQKEFLENLKLRYEDMPSAQEAELYISNIDANQISAIIAKAKSVSFDQIRQVYKVICEVKLFSLDIEKLQKSIDEIDSEINSKTQKLNLSRERYDAIRLQQEQANRVLQEELMKLSNKQTVLESQDSSFKKLDDEERLLEFELKDITETLSELIQKKEKNEKDLESLEIELNKTKQIIEQSQQRVVSSSNKRESVLLEITKLKTELTSLEDKESDLTNTLRLVQDSLSSDEESYQSQMEEKQKSKQKIIELENQIKELQQSILDSEDKLNRIEKQLCEEKERLNTKESEIISIQSQISKLNEESNSKRELIHQQDMQKQEISFKISQLKERMLQLYQYEVKLEEQIQDLNAEELQNIKNEIVIFREKIDKFGVVNLVAIEELEELKQRADFLQQQKDDLEKAKESLTEAIKKINKTTRKMFLDTFEKVQQEFRNYFRMFFGGGDAQLFLIDEENVLESGIEIICRPPGKKLQNILLLSGGEKSLAAIALIFAIFKTKPCPFCVLDEIDAALDEANVVRFSKMLKDFAKISQFIVITHNKKTIVNADVMYGITMEKSGVSKIVSVKLSESSKNENLEKGSSSATPTSNPQEKQKSSTDQPTTDPAVLT